MVAIFSVKSDGAVLWFALAELELLQPLNEGPSPQLAPALLPAE